MTDVKIGLETHIQLDTNSKLFCGCPNEEAKEPNTHVCPVCLGHPGSKPRLNKAVLRQAVEVAMALDCDINEDIFFSRKTYFYPDMSKNFQITQYEVPVGEAGEVDVKVDKSEKKIGITRLHIEEDPAKTEHKGGDIGESNYSLIDYNRAGTPLLEIVTDPDFRSPEEARAYLNQLAKIFEYLGVYDPESEFAIKSDANVSINGGQKVEVKNITGTSEVEKALSYEIKRQENAVEGGETITQQTRSYNADRSITKKMREKETEEDYGYIFDPDLTRQHLDQEFQERIAESIPELPQKKAERFQKEYGVSEKLVESLVADRGMADDFEQLAESYSPELVASWMTGELRKTLNYNELGYSDSPIELEWLDYLLGLLENEKISDRNAEKVLRNIVEDPKDPEKFVEKQDLLKAEGDEVDEIVEEVLEENPDAVDDFESGDVGAINFLVGQVMQNSGGKADPKTAREKIMERIG